MSFNRVLMGVPLFASSGGCGKGCCKVHIVSHTIHRAGGEIDNKQMGGAGGKSNTSLP